MARTNTRPLTDMDKVLAALPPEAREAVASLLAGKVHKAEAIPVFKGEYRKPGATEVKSVYWLLDGRKVYVPLTVHEAYKAHGAKI